MKEKSSQHFVCCGEQKKIFSSFIPSNWRKCAVEREKKFITEVGKLFLSDENSTKKLRESNQM